MVQKIAAILVKTFLKGVSEQFKSINNVDNVDWPAPRTLLDISPLLFVDPNWHKGNIFFEEMCPIRLGWDF